MSSSVLRVLLFVSVARHILSHQRFGNLFPRHTGDCGHSAEQVTFVRTLINHSIDRALNHQGAWSHQMVNVEILDTWDEGAPGTGIAASCFRVAV